MIPKKTAVEILKQLKKSKNILLALHVSPDEDSLASVLAMDLVLRKMGKKTKIISYSQINNRLSFFSQFPSYAKIENLDFAKIDLTKFDLFIALDAAQERMITRSVYPKIPSNLKVINIDHHLTSTKFGDINLVVSLSSTSEIVYHLLKEWKVVLTKTISQLLFAGIMADTGGFQYPLTTAVTLKTASDLMERGASLEKTVLEVFRSYNFKTLIYWGRILDNMQVDESNKFIWSKISIEEKEELGIDPVDIEDAASMFAPLVVGTEFGIILVEESPNQVRGSIRARKDFNVAEIALEFGAGGHKQAAGFYLNESLKTAEEKVLSVARKHLIANVKREGV